MKLRVATYNIHKGVGTWSKSPRIHAIRQALQMLDIDLVFLQEVQGRHDRHASRHQNWPQESQHTFLGGATHYAEYGKNASYRDGHHGNALLSRHPIIKMANHDISDHRFESRGILHCQVQLSKNPALPLLHCFTVHFGLFAASRKRQADALVEYVNSFVDAQSLIIIAGDFNDWRNNLSDALHDRLGVLEVGAAQLRAQSAQLPLRKPMLDFLPFNFFKREKSARLADHDATRHSAKFSPAKTFPAILPWLRLDRIYVRGFAVESVAVLRGKPWNALSDHAPLIAELSLLDAH